MNLFMRTAMVGLCLLLVLVASAPAYAQATRTLTIRDGKVWIDEQPVPQEDLPPSLDVQGVNARYTFVGDVKPMVELGDVLYILEGPHLREVADLRDEDGGVVVYFRDGAYAPYTADEAYLQQYARTMKEHSEELDKLSREVERQHSDQIIEQMRQQAQLAAEAAQSLPRLEVQSYLNEVQQQNQALYERLVSEWEMETEAQSLARKIQGLPPGGERQQLSEDLRRRLDAIFELKQENRRREIQQLEQQLGNLRARLQKREQYRQRIIQQRLDELTGKAH